MDFGHVGAQGGQTTAFIVDGRPGAIVLTGRVSYVVVIDGATDGSLSRAKGSSGMLSDTLTRLYTCCI